MDSDDDFGEFASVPATVKDASLDSPTFGFPPQKMQSTHPSALNGVSAEKHPAMSSNSDDDWGDFVEHSAPTNWGSESGFDWFPATEPSFGEDIPSFQAFTGDNADKSTLNFADSRESDRILFSELQHTQQREDSLGYDGLLGSWNSKEIEPSLSPALASVGSADTAMAVKTVSGLTKETEGRSSLKDYNSLPIPLSIFGDTERDDENSSLQLADPAIVSSQFHTGRNAVKNSLSSKGSKDLSNLIASLYIEAKPLSKVENPNTVFPDDLGESVDMSKNLSRNQSIADYGNYELEKRILTLSLGSGHVASVDSSKTVDLGSSSGVELQSWQSTTSELLNSVSETDQYAFVEAWSSMMAVCASELEFASEIWKQAEGAGVHLTLLADLKGKRYFAATGQLYVVALILAATLNVYKPWLQVATSRGERLCADLNRCKVVWLETNLKESVCLALDGLEGWIPTSVLSWKSIQQFSSVVLKAYTQAASTSVHSLCKLCLLPMDPFTCTGLPSIEWSGSKYLLPLANLWANCVSHQPPTSLST